MSEPDTILYELSCDEVVIPRAQLEAYRAFMEAMRNLHDDSMLPLWAVENIGEALAALRAAGIQTGE